MRLSALDIRKHEFARGFRGYDSEEVDSFLHMLAQQWQEMLDENRRLQDRLDEQAGKLSHYMKVEEALEEALETAREGARTRIENADRTAAATTVSAEREAEATLAEARSKSSRLLDEAETRAGRIVADAADSRRQARHDVTNIAMRRVELIARLRAFLSTELDVLSQYEAVEAERDAEFESTVPEVTPSATVAAAASTPALADAARIEHDDRRSSSAREESSVAPEPEPEPEPEIESAPAPELDPEPQSVEPESAESDIDTAAQAMAAPDPEPGEARDTEPQLGDTSSERPRSPIGIREGAQGELLSPETGDTTDEIKKIRRILEDLDS